MKYLNIALTLGILALVAYSILTGLVKFDFSPVNAVDVPSFIGSESGPYNYITAQDPVSGCIIAQVPSRSIKRANPAVIAGHLNTGRLLYIRGSSGFDYFVQGDRDNCPPWREMIRDGFN